jgi:hypothetical protein
LKKKAANLRVEGDNNFWEKMPKKEDVDFLPEDFMRLGYLVLILFLGFCVIAIYHAL